MHRSKLLGINRRRFLAGSASLLAAPAVLTSVTAQAAPVRLRTGTAAAQLLDEASKKAEIWAYEGVSPGPVVRVKKGDEVRAQLDNALADPTTIHWHGIRIDNAMDGVAHMTQDAVPSGEVFDYRFTAPDAGTFWYHPHTHDSWRQVAMGLYGVLIVEEDEPVDVDADVVMVLDDWRVREDGTLDTDSFGNFHDSAHFGRLGNVLTVNGKPYEKMRFPKGSRIRLRLVSTASARILRLRLKGGLSWVVALDGQPVLPYEHPERLSLGPGQRVDLMVDLADDGGGKIILQEVTGDNPLDAAEIVIANDNARELRNQPPSMLPVNPVPIPDANGPSQTVGLVMEGGAMRFLQDVIHKGENLNGRTAAMEHGQFWAFNGIAGMDAQPLFAASGGEVVEINMVNRTAFPHAIHLHGHHFIETRRSSGPVNEGLFDTVLLEADEAVSIALVADNPGKWMIHCHMLDHQASGMMSWFTVS